MIKSKIIQFTLLFLCSLSSFLVNASPVVQVPVSPQSIQRLNSKQGSAAYRYVKMNNMGKVIHRAYSQQVSNFTNKLTWCGGLAATTCYAWQGGYFQTHFLMSCASTISFLSFLPSTFSSLNTCLTMNSKVSEYDTNLDTLRFTITNFFGEEGVAFLDTLTTSLSDFQSLLQFLEEQENDARDFG